MSTTRKIPSPEPNIETKEYWAAAQEGKLLLKRCTGCGEHFHYPRAICPFCDNGETEWTEAKGTGKIYTFSVMRRVPAPYCIAFVTLDEGVTMMSNIVDCDFDAVRIGDRVQVTFRPSDNGQAVPMFTPRG